MSTLDCSARLERQTNRTIALVVCLLAAWFLVIGGLLIACGRSPVGTITKLSELPDGTYQLEVISGYHRDEGSTNPTFELINAGPSTSCVVGEVWPSCD